MDKKEIVMKLDVGDTAFVVKDDAVYKCEVLNRRYSENEDCIEKKYVVDRIIPKGLFDEEIRTEVYDEEDLFLDKKEAKEFLSNLKEARKAVNKYEDKPVVGYGYSIFDMYKELTNNK